MTTWKDGGDYGILYREIISEDGSRAICRVKVRQLAYHSKIVNYKTSRPYPQGEEDYRLILQAPRMLEALEAIVALKVPGWGSLGGVLKVYHQHKEIARAAIAAVKGEDSDKSGGT